MSMDPICRAVKFLFFQALLLKTIYFGPEPGGKAGGGSRRAGAREAGGDALASRAGRWEGGGRSLLRARACRKSASKKRL